MWIEVPGADNMTARGHCCEVWGEGMKVSGEEVMIASGLVVGVWNGTSLGGGRYLEKSV